MAQRIGLLALTFKQVLFKMQSINTKHRFFNTEVNKCFSKCLKKFNISTKMRNKCQMSNKTC